MMVGLYVDERFRPRCGPYKVCQNLVMGLERVGVEVRLNSPGDLIGCIHDFPGIMKLPASTLLGPNIFNRPRDRSDIMKRFCNFLVPSNWVRDMYRRDVGDSKKIVVWPVGIDVDTFTIEKNSSLDCLLYVKNRSDADVRSVRDMLDTAKQSYLKMTYGQYNEGQHLSALRRCRYCVLLTNTESQGIGYLETLASGTPCFVLNMDHYLDNPASSVPYFDDQCGLISKIKDDGSHHHDFGVFLASLSRYDPKSYILQNHTLELAASTYMQLLREAT